MQVITLRSSSEPPSSRLIAGALRPGLGWGSSSDPSSRFTTAAFLPCLGVPTSSSFFTLPDLRMGFTSSSSLLMLGDFATTGAAAGGELKANASSFLILATFLMVGGDSATGSGFGDFLAGGATGAGSSSE